MQKRRTECLVHNQKRQKRSLLHFDKIGGKMKRTFVFREDKFLFSKIWGRGNHYKSKVFIMLQIMLQIALNHKPCND